MTEFRTLVPTGSFYEAPRWHGGRWWVSDFYRNVVLSFAAGGEDERVELVVPARPSGLGWDPSNNLLVVSQTDHSLLRLKASGETEVVAAFGQYCNGFANDMVVDQHGGAYIGNAGFDLMGGAKPRSANLVHVAPNGDVAVAAEGMRFPNGSVLTDDGATLIVGETLGERYTAFSVGPMGALSDRRVWAELPGVAPDGCALDPQGRIWCADVLGRRAILIAEGGEILEELTAPADLAVYACALGGTGATGLTLLLCCAPNHLEHERRDATDACILAVDLPPS